MRIWIDGYEANVPQRLGSGQVAYQLLKNIAAIDKKNDYTVLLPAAPLPDMPKETVNYKYKIIRPKRLWTRIALPLELFKIKEKPDVFFSPTHYGPIFIPRGIKKVITIFDLAFLHYPGLYKKTDLYKLTNWTKQSIKSSDHIVTISNYSKSDIIKYFNRPKLRITVAHPGYDSKLFHPISDKNKVEEILNKYQISGDYIIFVGTIQPRKNLERLIEAVTKVENLKLVIVGKTKGEGRSGWMYEDILNKPKELEIEDRVIFTGFAPTEDLPYLLTGSIAYVLVSLYEGFGIPVVEAMATGTPVIVSNVSSLPEIVGKSGLLVEPNSVDQIEQAIRILYADKKLRVKMSKLAVVRARKFSWKKMTKEVLRVFSRVNS